MMPPIKKFEPHGKKTVMPAASEAIPSDYTVSMFVSSLRRTIPRAVWVGFLQACAANKLKAADSLKTLLENFISAQRNK